MKIGDKIVYENINLSDLLRFPKTGTIIRIERGPKGGDCFVKWDDLPQETEELLSNLKLAK